MKTVNVMFYRSLVACIFVALLLASFPSAKCYAAPQSAAATKAEWISQAAELLAKQQNTRVHDVAQSFPQGYWGDLEKLAVREGLQDLATELHTTLELEFERTKSHPDLLLIAMRYGNDESIRTLQGELSLSEQLLSSLMGHIEMVAHFESRPVQAFESVLSLVERGGPFRFDSLDNEPAKFEGKIKASCIDQLRLHFFHGLIEAKKFSLASKQIAHIGNPKIQKTCLAWWLANLPLSKTITQSQQDLLESDNPEYHFANAFRAAKIGDANTVLKWIDANAAQADTYQTALVLQTLVDQLATDKANSQRIAELLPTLITHLVTREEKPIPSIEFKSAGTIDWQFQSQEHLAYLIDSRLRFASLPELVETCKQLELMDQATGFANQLATSYEKAKWLHALANGFLESGNWKAAEKIRIDWPLCSFESQLTLKLMYAAAKSGDFTAAIRYSRALSSDKNLELQCRYTIAGWKHILSEAGDPKIAAEAKAGFELVTELYIRSIDRALEDGQTTLLDIANGLDDNFREPKLRLPLHEALAEKHDEQMELLVREGVRMLAELIVDDRWAYLSQHINQPDSSTRFLSSHIQFRAREAAIPNSQLDFARVHHWLHICRAMREAEKQGYYQMDFHSVAGTVDKFIAKTQSVYIADGDYGNDLLRHYAIEAARQGDKEAVDQLVAATSGDLFKVFALLEAAKHFPPAIKELPVRTQSRAR